MLGKSVKQKGYLIINSNKRTYNTMSNALLSTIPIALKKKSTFKRNIKRHLAMAKVIKILTNTLYYEVYHVKKPNENHFLFKFTNFVINFSRMHIFDFNKSLTINFNKSLTINPLYKSKTLEGYIFRHAALSLRIVNLDRLRASNKITAIAYSKSVSCRLDFNLLNAERYKTMLELQNDFKSLRLLVK